MKNLIMFMCATLVFVASISAYPEYAPLEIEGLPAIDRLVLVPGSVDGNAVFVGLSGLENKVQKKCMQKQTQELLDVIAGGEERAILKAIKVEPISIYLRDISSGKKLDEGVMTGIELDDVEYEISGKRVLLLNPVINEKQECEIINKMKIRKLLAGWSRLLDFELRDIEKSFGSTVFGDKIAEEARQCDGKEKNTSDLIRSKSNTHAAPMAAGF